MEIFLSGVERLHRRGGGLGIAVIASKAATAGGSASELCPLAERAGLPPFCPLTRTVCVEDARVGVRGGMTTGLECLSMFSVGSASVADAHARLLVRCESGFLCVFVPIFSCGLLFGEDGECWRYGKDLGEIMVDKSPCKRFPVPNDIPSPSKAREL